MSDYTLGNDLYLGITPGGSYYAVQDDTPDVGRNFLHNLLSLSETPLFNVDMACKLSGLKRKAALEFVHWMQEAGFIYGYGEMETAPNSSIESILPELLKPLSDEGKAILAESRGLYLGSAGYPHEVAEELAALSANLTAAYTRHKEVLKDNLGHRQKAWGLVDASGNSEIGFWPLYIKGTPFTLIIGGMPQLNQVAFKKLIWALEIRYGQSENLV
jgi:hypothetical protein